MAAEAREGKEPMNEEALRGIVASNIAYYRKLHGQTQAELAERLNYSDKSVSKWERGDGMPDVYVLTQIAELYGISVEDLLSSEPPATIAPLPGRILISLLSVGLCFLVAAVVFFALRMIVPGHAKAWMSFIFALPVSCIVMVVFTAIWWGYACQCIAVSGLVWSLAASIFLITSKQDAYLIYLVAGIVQVLVVLWFLLQSRRQKTQTRRSQSEEGFK
jgi:transcriptional regulator with XRE-family HTH domain